MATAGKYTTWLHSGFFGILQKISVPVSSILITMILAHKAISPQAMGVWALFMSITAVIELIRQGLVKTSLIKFINHSTNEEHKYVLSAALFLNATITVITALVLFFFARYFAILLKAPELENMLYILQAGMLIMIPFSHFEWLMYGKTQMKGLFWAYLFRQGITLLGVALIVLFTGKISLNMLVVIYNAAMLAGTVVLYKHVRPFLTHTFALSSEWVFRLLHFGKYVFGSGLSTLVFRSADQFMISPLLGSTAITASQNVSVRVINLADIPSQVLGDILFPKSARKENSGRKETIKYFYEKTVGATLCIIMPVLLAFVIFPKLIILILAGPQYLDAIPYLRLIAVTGIFLAFLKQFGVIMDSTGKPNINLAAITVLAAVHVVFCYVFISHFGLLGAAYALLCSHVTGFIITQILLYRYFGISFLNCFNYAFKFYPEFANIIFEKLNLKWKTP
jgi:O-antigen/teichoic acid export membrane protein